MSETPRRIPSLAELRTWLLDCSEELTSFERTLAAPDSETKRTRCIVGSSTSPAEREERLHALSVRLALISNLLAAQTAGVALMEPEQQLFELMLRAQIDRLNAELAARDQRAKKFAEYERTRTDFVELGLWPPTFPGVRLPDDAAPRRFPPTNGGA